MGDTMLQKILLIVLIVTFFVLELINQKLREKRASDYSQKPMLIAETVVYLASVVLVLCSGKALNIPHMLLGLGASLLVLLIFKFSFRRTIYRGLKEAFETHFGVSIASRLYIRTKKEAVYAIANGSFIRIISNEEEEDGEDIMEIIPLETMSEDEAEIYRVIQSNDRFRLF